MTSAVTERFCVRCGCDDSSIRDLDIEDLEETLTCCEDCEQFLFENELIDPVPPCWFFIIKPRRKRYESLAMRQIFDSKDEFKEWCDENSDKDPFLYLYGMYKSTEWSQNDRNNWISTGYETDGKFFWPDDSDEDLHPGETLIEAYTEGDNDIWDNDSQNPTYRIRDGFFRETIKDIDSQLEKLTKCKERIASLQESHSI